jgi:hypothetical protein
MRISRPGSGARELLFISPAGFKAELVVLGSVSEKLRPLSCLHDATCNVQSSGWRVRIGARGIREAVQRASALYEGPETQGGD